MTTGQKVNVGGVWKDVDSVKVNVGGVWKDAAEGWVNVGGVWKKAWPTGPPPPPPINIKRARIGHIAHDPTWDKNTVTVIDDTFAAAFFATTGACIIQSDTIGNAMGLQAGPVVAGDHFILAFVGTNLTGDGQGDGSLNTYIFGDGANNAGNSFDWNGIAAPAGADWDVNGLMGFLAPGSVTGMNGKEMVFQVKPDGKTFKLIAFRSTGTRNVTVGGFRTDWN